MDQQIASSESARVPPFELVGWSRVFSDSGLEQAYWEHHRKTWVEPWYPRIASFALLVMVIWIPVDSWVFPETFDVAWRVRVLVVIPAFGLVWWACRQPLVLRHWTAMPFAMAVLGTLHVYAVGVPTEGPSGVIARFFPSLYVVATAVLGALRPPHAAGLGGAVLALYLGLQLFWQLDPLPTQVYTVAGYLTATALAVLGVAMFHAMRRRAWWQGLVIDQQVRELEVAHDRADRLLLNVLPPVIAERLKAAPEVVVADRHEAVTVLFADLVGFTVLSSRISAARTVDLLNEVFSAFDAICNEEGAEKIKTIGDGYMAICGAPTANPDHAMVMTRVAVRMRDYMTSRSDTEDLQVRLGLNTGSVVGAIVGTSRFHYDVWGDTVNIAARMESHGQAGRIQIAQPTWALIRDAVPCEPRGLVEIKGKGPMECWFIS